MINHIKKAIILNKSIDRNKLSLLNFGNGSVIDRKKNIVYIKASGILPNKVNIKNIVGVKLLKKNSYKVVYNKYLIPSVDLNFHIRIYNYLKNFFLFFIFLHFFEFITFFELVSGLKSDMSFYKSYLIFIGMSLIDTINILPQNILISDVGYGLLTKYVEEDFQLGVVTKLYLRFFNFNSSIIIAIIYSVYINTLPKKI